MKHLTLQLLVSSFILLTFSGCIFCPEPEILVRDKIVYTKQPIPEINEPPTPMNYKVYYIKFNKKTYYIMGLDAGATMHSNYDRYKIWSENNYNILKELKKNSDTNTTKIKEK